MGKVVYAHIIKEVTIANMPNQGAGARPMQNMNPGAQPVRANVQPGPQQPVQQPVQRPMQQPVQQPMQQMPQNQMPQNRMPQNQAPQNPMQNIPNTDGNGTLFVGGSAETGQTVCLRNMSGSANAMITRLSNGEKVVVADSVFKIGKEKSYVNYCVTGNATVSRIHAQIEFDQGQYYLVDKKSMNKSFIQGVQTPMEPEKRYPLHNGDHFKLSNEEFVFEIK